MRTPHRWAPLLVYAAVAAGCATATGPAWSPVEDRARTVSVGRFHAELPAGWLQEKIAEPDKIHLSHDGPNLQRIEIVRVAKDNAFSSLKRGAPAGALPSELAELELADMKTRSGLENVGVVKNEPIRVADVSGYLLHTRFKNDRGLRYEHIIVGFVDASDYYTLSYQAPTLHYFARDRHAFDTLLGSLRPTGMPSLR